MRSLLLLTNRHRAPSTNRTFGFLLAFNAGAINAGGFLVLHRYTSHMTGFASQLGDALVTGKTWLLLGALGAILAFMIGAATCAVLINLGRHYRLHSLYALPLLLEAVLLFPFGLAGADTVRWMTPFAVPITVLLLSFMMGLQNAVASNSSKGSIRTTHMTGNLTDFGIELGKFLYWKSARSPRGDGVRHSTSRMAMTSGLMVMFVVGGGIGALGFKYVGFICVVPLAALLLALAVPDLVRDVPWRRTSTPSRIFKPRT